MTSNNLVRFSPGVTPLHTLCGQVKVLLFIVTIILTISTFDCRILLAVTAVAAAALASLKPNWKIIWALMLVAMGLNTVNLILFYLFNPHIGCEFVGTCTELFRFTERLVMPAETLWYFAVRTLKVVAMFLVSLWLIFVVTPTQLAAGFNRVGLPYKLSMVFSIALRYLPDLIKDYKNISASIQARGLELGRKKTTLKAKIEGVVSIAVPLILSSFDDVGVIADALDLRGFGKNKKRTWYVETPYGRLDKICLVLAAVLAALTAVGAFIRIPIGISVITLQFLFTAMAGVLLGPGGGALSQGVYVALGLVGLPIFTAGGGFGYVLQPSFGFLLGLIPAAAVIGGLSRSSSPVRLALACGAGLAVLYAVGVPYMALILNGYLGKGISAPTLLWSGMLIYLPGDAAKIAVTALLCPVLRRRIPGLR